MVSPDANSFPLINGRLSIRNSTIYVTSDAECSRIDRLFGRNLQRRSIVFAIVFGLPLAVVSIFLMTHGQFHAAVYPAFFAVMFLTSPLYYIGMSNPDHIPICDIQTVVGCPPRKYRSLGNFTLHFVLGRTQTKTAIALPYADHEEQLLSFDHAVAIFERAGITVVENAKPTG